MKRHEIARVLKRHRGSKAEVARRAGVENNVVSMWLSGGSNANVAGHAEIHAKELIAKEEHDRRAGVEATGPSVRKVIDRLRKESTTGGRL